MFRIRKTLEGYVVERKIITLRFIIIHTAVWIPYVEITGIPGMAWNHLTYASAMNNLLSKVEEDTNLNS